MKKTIFSIMIGDDPVYQYAKKAMQSYANKINVDLIILTENKYLLHEHGEKNTCSPAKLAWAQKLHIKEVLENYDRVLYLDGDILVTPQAPNIFTQCPRLDAVYMLPEGLYVDRSTPIQQISPIFPLTQPWPKKQGKYLYHNVGVMLLSRQANPFKYAKLNDLTKIHKHVDFYEQTYLNYLCFKHNIPIEPLIPEYNRMDLFGINEERLKAYFIHYAGGGYSGKCERRYRTVMSDYYLLYGEEKNALVKFIKLSQAHRIYYRRKLYRLWNKIKKWSKNPRCYLFRKN